MITLDDSSGLLGLAGTTASKGMFPEAAPIFDALVVEAFTWTPHLETAGEIALRWTEEGKRVGFCFIGNGNPDDRLGGLARAFGSSRHRKVRRFEDLLEEHGVYIVPVPRLSCKVRREIAAAVRHCLRRRGDPRDFCYKGIQLGLGVGSSVVSSLGESAPTQLQLRRLGPARMRAAAEAYEATKLLIEKYRPSDLVTFNGRHAMSKGIVEATKSVNVNLWRHERGADPSRFDLQQESFHDVAALEVRIAAEWSKGGKDRAARGRSFFERRRAGDGIGWRSFTASQERGHVPRRTKPFRVVYFASSDDEFASVDIGVANPLFRTQMDAVLWLLDVLGKQEDIEIIIRMHPNMARAGARDRQRWHRLSQRDLYVLGPEDPCDSYALAESADLVVVFISTMGIEAAYWGTPTIAMGHPIYRTSKAVMWPRSREALANLLRSRAFTLPRRDDCLPFGHFMITRGRPFRHFSPRGFAHGMFLQEELTSDSWVVARLRSIRRSLRGVKRSMSRNN